nr:hypothetical protein [Cereibacter changlensis]
MGARPGRDRGADAERRERQGPLRRPGHQAALPAVCQAAGVRRGRNRRVSP